MPPDPHGPPGDLDTTARDLYRKLRKFMRDRPPGPTQWEDSDKYILGQTCRYEMRARIAWQSLAASSEGAGITMTTRGRSEFSGDVAHPLVRIAEQAEKAFVDGLDRCGFTPKARAAMGIEPRPPAGESKFGL